ncbi:hypothetical protein POM88_002105 [Heracleum sosnowskyi]|uniref:RING-type E3 ubiquitin transferase n=1 Tax=Heracleum sosnowskyi TaxID=360622 RepID=A0AAD8JDH4_9APIA|nr:hypothetical protein POM88_002105 [Heracleum sosnowskyi]
MEIAPAIASSSSQIETNLNNNSNNTHIENKNVSSKFGYDFFSRKFDDDEDEDMCRICRNSGDAENPLRYHCACSGSIKFVHQDCLLQWLNHSNARTCEVT